MRWRGVALGVLVILRVAALIFLIGRLPSDVTGHYVANDALRYQQIAATPGTPYRDFPVEVPPVELAELKALVGPDPRTTAITLAWFQLILDLLVVAGLLTGWGSDAALGYLVVSLPLVPFIYFRIDLLSVGLAVWAMALLERRSPSASGAPLALAVMAKLWPLALLPAYLVRRAWTGLTSAVGLIVVLTLAWIAWVGLEGPREVLTFRGSHGWQIESVVGALAVLLTQARVVFDGGALRIGNAAVEARAALLAAAGATVASAWAIAWRRRDERVGLPSLVAVAAMLVFSPILSWQYVFWLVPWVGIALAEGEWAVGGLAMAVSAMTGWMIFQSIPLSMRSGLAEFVVNARNMLLALLVLWGFVRLLRRNTLSDATRGAEPAALSADAATLAE